MHKLLHSVLAVVVALLAQCRACTDRSHSAAGEIDPEPLSRNVRQVSAGDSGAPELPRVFLDTRQLPSNGRRLTVSRGSDLQRALDDARPGDAILLEPGASFVGNFVLRNKQGAGWITIEPASAATDLPPEGTRVGPALASRLPKLVTPNDDPALSAESGAHHVRIVGLEITAATSVRRNSAIVQFGGGRWSQLRREDIPHHLIIDRSYVHGHVSLATRRCVVLNSAFSAVIDSYLSDCHDRGFDSQAIIGWNGPGPYKIVNNYLEGAGENVLFGGGDPTISGLIPSDIEIRHNHFYKPLSWKGVWTVKNLFELKNAQRVLVEGNVFENNWIDAQDGFAILLKSTNQDGGAPWSVTRNVTFRYNKIINIASGVNILGAEGKTDESANHILIANNLFDRVGTAEMGGAGRLWQLIDDPSDVRFVHNTGLAPYCVLMLDVLQKPYITIRDNIVTRGEYGIFGGGQSEGKRGIDFYLPHSSITHNVIVGAQAEIYPPGNFFPARLADVGFVDAAHGDYRLSHHSPYKEAGTDARDLGADIERLDAETAGVVRKEQP